jgi:predicted GH43/DUF377 family glycosyl hydrolase
MQLRRAPDDHLELGAAPVKTDRGWLVIYSHIYHYDSGHPVFGIEAILLDINDPRKIIGRTTGNMFTTEEYYEKVGMVRNVNFPSGAAINGRNLEIYYGAADTHCAMATVNLENLLDSMTSKNNIDDTGIADIRNEIETKGLRRYTRNPIIKPRPGLMWEARGTINPAAIELRGKIYIIYRAFSDKNVSSFGLAITTDGYNIEERPTDPIYRGHAQFETAGSVDNNFGVEDPRVTEFGDTLYFSYTGYNGKVPRVAIVSIKTEDFINKRFDKWSEPQVVSPDYIDDKDACFLPETTNVNGDGEKYMIFHRIGLNVCVDFVGSLDFKHLINRCFEIFGPRPGMWDSLKVGISAPPIKTKKGWFLFYHGISDDHIYRVGALLLDLADPTKIIARMSTPILEPLRDYELTGLVPHVVFPCGAVVRKDKVFVYYGGGDSVIGVATGSMKNLLKGFE